MTSHHFNIETIGIVGTRAMGHGFAQFVAQAGLARRRDDANPPAVAMARDCLAHTFAKLAAKGKLDARAAQAARASGTHTLGERTAGCDLVIEATDINEPNEARA